jgi:hypothetical protein
VPRAHGIRLIERGNCASDDSEREARFDPTVADALHVKC